MNTREHRTLHQLLTSLIKYQKGVCYLGSRAFSNIPSYIKTVSTDPKQFKSTLKYLLHIYTHTHTPCTLHMNIFTQITIKAL